MQKKSYLVVAILLVLSMLLAACAPAATPAATEEPAAPAQPEKKGIKVCQVTDTGGIDDKSFNATAWKGAEMVKTELGGEAKYLESQQQTDYEKNINAFIEEKCDLIVTVGFLLGDATKLAAEANPDQKFAIVDFAYDPTISNVLGLTFATDQAGFLAGYLAAASTKTGKVATFGGLQIPTVTVFMDGYVMGVRYYNEKNSAKVEVLGWDPEKQTGAFVGNFESTDDGKNQGIAFMDQGADIIMPVAGPVGLGTAAAVKERGNAWVIGVDSDWTVSASEYKDIVLTSVVKNMDVAVFDASKAVGTDTYAGGIYVGTLENGGVGLPESSVMSADLKAQIEALKADIIAGKIMTTPKK